AAGPARPAVVVQWRLQLDPGVTLVRVEARAGRAPASELRRLAAAAGVEVLDLAASRPVQGVVSTALDCRANEARLQVLLAKVRRLPGVTGVELLTPASIQ
ncbi:MAG TPA: hypothetical protein VFA70_02395, partial [Dehalococcoidia bacterium]|nr:hypothetical protein [Dehalococcoidia bacterium]